ncbi:MAG: hypothetical protein ACQEXQ_24330 [Bacillota bacterium]
MKRKPEIQSIRKQLDIELSDVQFNEQLQMTVLNKACPPSFWNRELNIPWPAVAIVLCLIIAMPVIGWRQLTSAPSSELTTDKKAQLEGDDKLIVMAGGAFYESELREGWPRTK